MKISDVIKTPVGIDGKRVFVFIVDDESNTARLAMGSVFPLQVEAAIHAINQHDKLVDLVGRMRVIMVDSIGITCPACGGVDDHENDCDFGLLLKESEGIE